MTYTRQQFIDKLSPVVIEDMRRTKILASLTMAQAILESGSGNSGLTQKGNALFGIKAGSSWSGKVVTMKTQEWDGSRFITIDAKFRAYSSWSESVYDHSRLFHTVKLSSGVNGLRYGNLIGETNYKTACRNVQKDGYATDPKYAESLINLIEKHKLYELDQKALNGGSKEMTQDKFNQMLAVAMKKVNNEPGSDWSRDDRQWAVDNGIVTGTTDKSKSIDDPSYMWQGQMTREQAVVVIRRLVDYIKKEVSK